MLKGDDAGVSKLTRLWPYGRAYKVVYRESSALMPKDVHGGLAAAALFPSCRVCALRRAATVSPILMHTRASNRTHSKTSSYISLPPDLQA